MTEWAYVREVTKIFENMCVAECLLRDMCTMSAVEAKRKMAHMASIIAESRVLADNLLEKNK